MASSFRRLVRFIPKSSSTKVLIGEPVNESQDVGLALYKGEAVEVTIYSGSSILTPGQKTDKIESIDRVLSPLAVSEVGTIRCIGLNYRSHAKEVHKSFPPVPSLFLKPATALADPWPARSVLPRVTQVDNTGDYESEMAIIIGREAKDVREEDALQYVLGYTAANDVSSRTSQFVDSQWCFSKGFDTACPLGPVVASSQLVPDPSKLRIKGTKNGKLLQESGLGDLIYNTSQIIAHLSQGTTLPAGTVILTGTPAGVGIGQDPKNFLKAGDEFTVEISPYVGTLITQFENQASKSAEKGTSSL